MSNEKSKKKFIKMLIFSNIILIPLLLFQISKTAFYFNNVEVDRAVNNKKFIRELKITRIREKMTNAGINNNDIDEILEDIDEILEELDFIYNTLEASNSNTQEESKVEIITFISICTSLVSLIGIASTTALSWRKEKRESRLAKITMQKNILESRKIIKELEEHEEQ